MRKLTIVLLLIGFQLQLLAQESTEPQPLNRSYIGIEPHVFLNGSYILGGMRFGKNRRWSYETAFGVAFIRFEKYYNMNQFAIQLPNKKNKITQLFFGEYIVYNTNPRPDNLEFVEYYTDYRFNNILYFEAPLSIGLLVGYRRQVFSNSKIRLMALGMITLGDYPTRPAALPILGIRLTTK